MNAYNIAAPEDIAKKYGGNKKKIQQAAAQGLINPTEAVMAGMFIDRMRNAAAQEQAQQPTVAEQVMNPQPQMPPQGMAATPQAQQMPQQAQMGAPMQRMAMGGGVNSIPFDEGDYAEGGIVGFNRGDAVRAEFEALGRRRDDLKKALVELENRPFYMGSEKQSLQNQLAAVERRIAQGPSFAETPIEPVERNYPDVQQAPGQLGFQLPAAPAAPAAPRSDSTQYPADTVSGRQYPDVQQAPGQLSFELPGPQGSPAEANAYTSGSGLAGTQEAKDFGVDAVPLTTAQQEMADQQLRLSQKRANAPLIPAFLTDAYDAVAGRNVVGSDDYVRTQGTADMNALTRTAAEKEPSDGLMGLVNQGIDFIRGKGEELGRAVAQRDRSEAGVAEAEANLKAVQDQVAQREAGLIPTMRGPTAEDIQTTLPDQVAATEDTAKTLAGTDDTTTDTTTKGDVDKTAGMEDQNIIDPFSEEAAKTEAGSFLKEVTDIMGTSEKGEFRKEMEDLVKNRGERLKSAKKEAFNMALLQAGLGLLGQQGGQTALQALGKAALPATKQYASAVKDAKKEDKELLKLGLAMEQMDAKELAATKRTVAQLYGQRANAMLNAAVSTANNVRTTQASIQVGMASAAARRDQARATNLLTNATKLISAQSPAMTRIESIQGKLVDLRNDIYGKQQGMQLEADKLKLRKNPDDDELAAKIAATEADLEKRYLAESKGLRATLDKAEAYLNQIQSQIASVGAGDIANFRVK
jgi:hypothetical protein